MKTKVRGKGFASSKKQKRANSRLSIPLPSPIPLPTSSIWCFPAVVVDGFGCRGTIRTISGIGFGMGIGIDPEVRCEWYFQRFSSHGGVLARVGI